MFSFLTFLLAAAASVTGVCPPDYEHHGESCYHFVTHGRSWDGAMAACHGEGAFLTNVETEEENKYILGFLDKHRDEFYGYDLWLGARSEDDSINRTFFWLPTKTPLNFTDWSAGQPDGDWGGLERCVELEAAFNNQWNDDECSDYNFYVCERPFNPPVPPLPKVNPVG